MKRGKEYVAMMRRKKRKSRLKRGERVIFIIIIVKAGRHGVSVMPWPSTDSGMKENMDDGVDGKCNSDIIGGNEKKKGWKSQAFPTKKNGVRKTDVHSTSHRLVW